MNANATPRICAHCGAIVPEGHHYCDRCGTFYAGDGQLPSSQTLFYGPMQAPGRAKLILIHGEGIQGVSYHLNLTEHLVGRAAEEVEIAFEDASLSPRHANFFYHDNRLFLRDEGSVNGTFIRVREPWQVDDRALVLAGNHRFIIERVSSDAPAFDEEGTRVHVSPASEVCFRVVELLHGGLPGAAYASPHGEVAVGREACDMTYPDDTNMSRRHFKVTELDGQLVVTDLGSKNGTFVRLLDSHRLEHGDYVFIGRQLLRVELTT